MHSKSKEQNCKILFIDDSLTEINYLQLLFQITDLPADPIFMNSVLDAVDVLRNYTSDDFPDFIIVDINMPLMNGFEFAKIYAEELLQKHPKTKLFIYSTSIHSVDIQRAESIEGVTGFIPKPFDENTFNTRILPFIQSTQDINIRNLSSP